MIFKLSINSIRCNTFIGHQSHYQIRQGIRLLHIRPSQVQGQIRQPHPPGQQIRHPPQLYQMQGLPQQQIAQTYQVRQQKQTQAQRQPLHQTQRIQFQQQYQSTQPIPIRSQTQTVACQVPNLISQLARPVQQSQPRPSTMNPQQDPLIANVEIQQKISLNMRFIKQLWTCGNDTTKRLIKSYFNHENHLSVNSSGIEHQLLSEGKKWKINHYNFYTEREVYDKLKNWFNSWFTNNSPTQSSINKSPVEVILYDRIIHAENFDKKAASEAFNLLQDSLRGKTDITLLQNAVESLLNGALDAEIYFKTVGHKVKVNCEKFEENLGHFKQALIESKEPYSIHPHINIVPKLQTIPGFFLVEAKKFEKLMRTSIVNRTDLKKLKCFFSGGLPAIRFFREIKIELTKEVLDMYQHYFRATRNKALNYAKLIQDLSKIFTILETTRSPSGQIKFLCEKINELRKDPVKRNRFCVHVKFLTDNNQALGGIEEFSGIYYPENPEVTPLLKKIFLHLRNGHSLPEELQFEQSKTVPTSTNSSLTDVPVLHIDEPEGSDIPVLQIEENVGSDFLVPYVEEPTLPEAEVTTLQLHIEDVTGSDMPILHIEDPEGDNQKDENQALVPKRISRDSRNSLRTPSPIQDEQVVVPQQLLSMPVVTQEPHKPNNPAKNKKSAAEALATFFSKQTHSRLKVYKEHFVSLLNEDISVETFLDNVNISSSDARKIYYNSMKNILEEGNATLINDLKSDPKNSKKLHWSFSDIYFDHEFTKKFLVRASESDSQMENSANINAPVTLQKSVPAKQTNAEFKLDFQLASSWKVTAFSFKTTRECTVIITSNHIFFFPSSVKISKTLSSGVILNYRLFPDLKSGKVYLPDMVYPAKVNETFFKIVSNLQEFKELFLNVHGVNESSVLFEKSVFEDLSLKFEETEGCEYSIAVNSPIPEADNLNIKFLSNIFGTPVDSVVFKGLKIFTHIVPVQDIPTNLFHVYYYGVLLTGYLVLFPFVEEHNFFAQNIICMEEVGVKETCIATQPMMKMMFPLVRGGQPIELASRPTKLRHAMLLDLNSDLTDLKKMILEFITNKKTVALKGSNEKVQSFIDSLKRPDYYVYETHPITRVSFRFDCVAKIDLKGGSFYVFYLNLSANVPQFEDLKFFAMSCSDKEDPTKVFSLEFGAVIEKITKESNLYAVKFTTKSSPPNFRSEKVRYIRSRSELVGVLSTKESCLTGIVAFEVLVEKTRHWSCLYGGKIFEGRVGQRIF